MINNSGILYLCATPIGNLEDMTYRAVRILQEVTVIAAEDTRHTRKLLSHFDIHTPLISYHEHNKDLRGPEFINRLLSGESVAIVSDAGLPGISDPGAELVKLAVEADITVSPLPGPNAALSALICSGLDTKIFTFVGFLPKTAKKRRELLENLAKLPYTLVIYESPHRLDDTLKELVAAFGDRSAVTGRELTKKFEEFQRGTLKSLVAGLVDTPPRGEYTIVIAGKGDDLEPEKQEVRKDPKAEVFELINAGMTKKEAIKAVAMRQGKSRREIYQLVVNDGEE